MNGTCLYSAMIKQVILYGSPAYFSLTIDEVQILKRVQDVATRLIASLGFVPYED